jgi:hypothetical protein
MHQSGRTTLSNDHWMSVTKLKLSQVKEDQSLNEKARTQKQLRLGEIGFCNFATEYAKS